MPKLRIGTAASDITPKLGVGIPGYFNMRKASIYGGTNEVQRNIMAKLVLGL